MKISLLTYGSRGDVDPFIEISKGLLRAGFQVTLAAPKKFKSLVSANQIEYVSFPGNPQQLVQDLVDQAGGSWLRMVREMSSFVLPLAAEVSQLARFACRNADLIIHSFLLTNTGYEIARDMGIPDISALTFPVFTNTGAFPAPVAPDLPLGDGYRRLTHALVTQIFWQGSRVIYRLIRKKHPELPPLTSWPFNPRNPWQTPIMYAFSPQVVHRPADWRESVHITGYWFSADERDWKPEPKLRKFLENGPAPIAVVFGSTSTSKLAGIHRKVIEALKITGQRGIILGTEPRESASPDIYWHNKYIPYTWLFEKAGAVIHHGGAGTTGKALRAGIPSIILPFTSDQPFWGRQVYKLGAGPKPLAPNRFSAAQLSRLLNTVIYKKDLTAKASRIGQRMRNEDGVSNAVGIIEGYMHDFRK